VEALAEASGTSDSISTNITGTDAGFEAFCQNQSGATGATRAISTDEEAQCLENGVVFNEYLIGHNIVAAVTHPELEFAVCLDLTALEEFMTPSASGVINDWTDLDIIDVETPEATPLSVYLPPANTATYSIVDEFVDGFGLRADANIIEDDAAILDAVAETPGAIGFVSLAVASQREDVNLLQISPSLEEGCRDASADNVENRTYPLGDRLFLYVNQNVNETATVNSLLELISDPASSEAIAEAGFTPPTESAYSTNQAITTGEEEGRQFSLEAITFEIPVGLTGNIAVGGGAHLSEYIRGVTGQFNSLYAGVTFEVQTDGIPGGQRRLCNGEIDLLSAYQPLPEDIAQNCEANNIDTVTFDLGGQGVVLVANAEDSYLECLTRDQLQTIWSATASADEAVNIWSQVDDSFPEDPIFLFTPAQGSPLTDILLTPTQGPVNILRDDVTESGRSPLYRAAAVANETGTLTYMGWQDYTSVLENGQENIQIVAVDDGDGCITPDVANITDGTYPLGEQALLIANQSSLVRPEVQSLLWFMFSDENFSAYENTDFIGLTQEQLPEIRADLQSTFAEAQAAELEVGPEITPEPGAEATVEPDAEATEEANNEYGE
jgi:phosphate transport system substrate-binding protein